jgi:hypothetical protein
MDDSFKCGCTLVELLGIPVDRLHLHHEMNHFDSAAVDSGDAAVIDDDVSIHCGGHTEVP